MHLSGYVFPSAEMKPFQGEMLGTGPCWFGERCPLWGAQGMDFPKDIPGSEGTGYGAVQTQTKVRRGCGELGSGARRGQELLAGCHPGDEGLAQPRDLVSSTVPALRGCWASGLD